MMPLELFIAIPTAALLGASAHRAGLCTVRAVEEVMTTRKGHILWSFLKASIWTSGILTWAALLGSRYHLDAHPLTILPLLGGLMFGLGAGLNGACALSTFSRLADGHLAMILTLAGWGVSMYLIDLLIPVPDQTMLASQPAHWLVLPLTIWMIWEGRRILQRARNDGRTTLTAAYWPLSLAVLVLAGANAALILLDKPWSFTATAICSTGRAANGSCRSTVDLWLISGTALTTMIISAKLRGSFRIHVPGLKIALRHFAAGLIMGAGASLIPGGNDGLILFGLPTLSPHAFLSWLAIVLGIFIALSITRLSGGRIPRIRCEADVCRAEL